jgi:hypothetical protein
MYFFSFFSLSQLQASFLEQMQQARVEQTRLTDLVAARQADVTRLQHERDSLAERLAFADSRLAQMQEDLSSKVQQTPTIQREINGKKE